MSRDVTCKLLAMMDSGEMDPRAVANALKYKTLLPSMVTNWTRDYRGFPRITKYVRQLNAAAEVKAAPKRVTW